jgi:hypothetical protein
MLYTKILGKYQITYLDHNNITQIKYLISHIDFEDIVKPTQKEIHILLSTGKKSEANVLKNALNLMFSSEFFTDKSPIFEACNNGGYLTLLPYNGQSATSRCDVTKIS